MKKVKDIFEIAKKKICKRIVVITMKKSKVVSVY